eukprot:CAMPEP_0113313516 /NCGR_PEP_ID=MMETSP0010_2-20120614/9907_1 /TAXON_ID=216773 ORGANISM="Corethron hystrix, Strain 308" /NCGR_SAMPLE_ID=MMETSP0010_2 /ASSEMBLY_ACC=CAM_ASM_000155 /LENGTH=296 /DNA_ID=CAMNT_0000169541 /DNA_START=132 /DNA_END=1022 /DNA_ORIENTATION=+ /assembly_acc=CAM_ASM_000155
MKYLANIIPIVTIFPVANVYGFFPKYKLPPNRSPDLGNRLERRQGYTHFNQREIQNNNLASVFALRGGMSGDEVIGEVFEWCSNLGAPAALVAGAVLATFSEAREKLTTRRSDSNTVRRAKKLTKFLLLTAFGLQIVCIFVTTVMGTMLKSYGDNPLSAATAAMTHKSALGFMQKNYEFEYLATRVSFLQGLFNWLLAIAVEFAIPDADDTKSSLIMDRFISWTLLSIVLLMLSFYNGHMTFYQNYGEMVSRCIIVTWRRFFWRWPPRPMSLVTIPSLVMSIIQGYRAFRANDEDE